MMLVAGALFGADVPSASAGGTAVSVVVEPGTLSIGARNGRIGVVDARSGDMPWSLVRSAPSRGGAVTMTAA